MNNLPFSKTHDQHGTSDPDPEPRQHYEVHCGRCKWWGHKVNLNPEFGCPMCLSDQYLEYKEDQHEDND